MRRDSSPPAVAALVAAVGLGAFLLFEIEFVSAKWLLPWFGGTASVWTTCMLFFQTGLLLGYVWAHRTATFLSPRAQARAHMALVGLALAALLAGLLRWPSPVTPGPQWRPAPAADPIGGLLVLLSASVGLPFVTLAATGPLMQAWFTRLAPRRSPWPLYALSNLGSLLGVVLYPLVVEPLLPVRTQGYLWASLFVLYAACVAWVARTQTGAPGVPAPEEAESAPREGRGFWWALSITTSLGFLAVTSQLSLDVAVVPFLWTVPLLVYLGTFIWAFSRPGRFGGRAWGVLLVIAAVAAGTVYWEWREVRLPAQVATWLVYLFFLCAFGHGELARRRPAASKLTEFYLTLAAGGAVGGLVAAVAAPAFFKGIWELPITIYLGLLLPLASRMERGSGKAFATPARRLWALSGSGLALFAGALALALQVDVRGSLDIASARNFYGSIQVVRSTVSAKPPEVVRQLVHGQTVHGMQFERPQLAQLPTTYYGPSSGVGRALTSHIRRREARPLRVGVVGLGVGTLAAWGRPGDVFRFYEINPAVIALSAGPRPVFTFLARSRARVEVIPGDARLSLEREPPQRYDVLVLDAFSSDAVPVHLLTVEAFDVYLRHLSGPEAVIAVNVSNANLRLGPVVRGAAARHGLFSEEINEWGALAGTSASEWVVASRVRTLFDAPAFRDGAEFVSAPAVLPCWTDSYSNLLRSFRAFSGGELTPRTSRPRS